MQQRHYAFIARVAAALPVSPRGLLAGNGSMAAAEAPCSGFVAPEPVDRNECGAYAIPGTPQLPVPEATTLEQCKSLCTASQKILDHTGCEALMFNAGTADLCHLIAKAGTCPEGQKAPEGWTVLLRECSAVSCSEDAAGHCVQGGAAGAGFSAILLVGLVLYVTVGLAYNVGVRGAAPGVSALPNHEFWREVAALARDGLAFTRSGGGAGVGAGGHHPQERGQHHAGSKPAKDGGTHKTKTASADAGSSSRSRKKKEKGSKSRSNKSKSSQAEPLLLPAATGDDDHDNDGNGKPAASGTWVHVAV